MGRTQRVPKDIAVAHTGVEKFGRKDNGSLFFFGSNFTQKSVEHNNYLRTVSNYMIDSKVR